MRNDTETVQKTEGLCGASSDKNCPQFIAAKFSLFEQQRDQVLLFCSFSLSNKGF